MRGRWRRLLVLGSCCEVGIGNIEFEAGVLEIMSFVDEVFAELGQPPILENPHFRICKEWAFKGLHPSMVCFLSTDCDKRIRVLLEITFCELRLDLDRANECPIWIDIEDLKQNREYLKKQLLMIFGRPIIVTHKGNCTRFQICEPEGKVVANWKYYEGLSFSFLYRKSRIWHLKPFFCWVVTVSAFTVQSSTSEGNGEVWFAKPDLRRDWVCGTSSFVSFLRAMRLR